MRTNSKKELHNANVLTEKFFPQSMMCGRNNLIFISIKPTTNPEN